MNNKLKPSPPLLQLKPTKNTNILKPDAIKGPVTYEIADDNEIWVMEIPSEDHDWDDFNPNISRTTPTTSSESDDDFPAQTMYTAYGNYPGMIYPEDYNNYE